MTKPLDTAWPDLPNGFHDAELGELTADLARAEVRLGLEFWTGKLDAAAEAERESRRRGVLRLQGVTAMVIEPPAEGYRFTTGGGALVDGGVGPYPGDPTPPDDGLVRLWFYVSTWNARMLFTAKTAELEWLE
jgi:hypothetical protein